MSELLDLLGHPIPQPKPKPLSPPITFDGLDLFSYDLIMADPPWEFETYSERGHKKAPQAHYECMPEREIAALPVGTLAAGDCLLWLWATNPMLPVALRVMEAWGFKFVTAGTWAKQSSTGRTWAFGTGYVLRSANEPFLIGTVGSPTVAKNIRSLVVAPRRENSEKPEVAYTQAERLIRPHTAPAAPRMLDLFSRQTRKGWDAWGKEAGKFDVMRGVADAA